MQSCVNFPREKCLTSSELLHRKVGFKLPAPQCRIHTRWRNTLDGHKCLEIGNGFCVNPISIQKTHSGGILLAHTLNFHMHYQATTHMYLQKKRHCGKWRNILPEGCSNRKQCPSPTKSHANKIDLISMMGMDQNEVPFFPLK